MPLPAATRLPSYNGDYMAEGKKAEEIVLAFLMDRPEILGIDDFRNLRAVHESDIDFAIKTRDGRVTLAEVKSCRHLGRTNNVLFEILRINHTCITDKSCILGWSARSPAQYFLYYAPSVHKIYQFRVDKLRKAMQEYTRQTRDKMNINIVSTDSIKTTVCILIPSEYWKHIAVVHDLEP